MGHSHEGRDGRARGNRGGPHKGAGRGQPRTRREAGGRRAAPTRRTEPPSRSGGTTEQSPVHLSDDIVRELRATARPGKEEILVKVFGEAAGAFADEDYGTAIRLAEQSKHMALRAASVRELLGLAYYRSDRWQEAARELSAFRRISGTTEQNPVLADCYRAMGKPQRAVELCDEIDARNIGPAVFYEGQIVAAGALAEMGRIDEAITRLEALNIRPEVAEQHHLRTWYVLADLLERKGRFTQAREWFEAVAAVDADLTDAPERVERLR